MTPDTLYVAHKDVVDCDIGGDRALMHLDTNTYFTMNATASALWLALTHPRSLDDLVGVVTERFEVAPEQCRDDVAALVDQMLTARIVEVVPAEVAR